jgi:hypothetical protein
MRARLIRIAAFLTRNERLLLSILVASVLIAGLGYSILLGDTWRYYPDEWEYTTLATNIATQGIYTLDGEAPTAYRPPGYPIFLAFFRFLGAGVIQLRFLNFILLGSCIYLVSQILGKQSTSLSAVLGPLLVIGYPVMFYTAGTLYPQTSASFLLLFSLYLVTKNTPTLRDFSLAGLLLGCLILTVPVFAFILLILPGWLMLQFGYRRYREILICVILALSVVAIWAVRNYVVFDRVVFISTNSGENLLLGNSENTTPNAGTNADISQYRSQAAGMDEVERDRFFREKAIEYIRNHPAQAAKLYILKVFNYFNYQNELVTATEDSTTRDILMLVSYGPLLLLLIARLLLVKLIKPDAFEAFLICLYLLSGLVNAIFFTRIRFRVPFDFLLIMIVSIFCARLFAALLLRREKCVNYPSIG